LLFASTYVPVAMVFQPPIKYICTLFAGGSEGGRLKLTFHFHPALTLRFKEFTKFSSQRLTMWLLVYDRFVVTLHVGFVNT
jgi:hypothetical protein